ncbi:hypothetical protein BWO91_14270 [Plantibacter flavus]|uniref:hypothetical protein n=1 Tax=Plantibacter flavus TaxID=150123 RepID=UPI00099DEFFB|nr:hypothetical protein [Plantibacter flavus]AQX80973.1 hypothetical protein BWO91_14270 [Plantibacter flavus]
MQMFVRTAPWAYLAGFETSTVLSSSGLFYELTTDNLSTLARHSKRSYVDPTRIAKYNMWT